MQVVRNVLAKDLFSGLNGFNYFYECQPTILHEWIMFWTIIVADMNENVIAAFIRRGLIYSRLPDDPSHDSFDL